MGLLECELPDVGTWVLTLLHTLAYNDQPSLMSSKTYPGICAPSNANDSVCNALLFRTFVPCS
jgi:hypothetical protein